MFQNGIASLESIMRSFLGAVALFLVVMLVAGGLGLSGPVVLTIALWVSILGVLAVGVFLIARARRPYAGAGALVAALAVWMAYFCRSNPWPFLWPVVFLFAIGPIEYDTRGDSMVQ